MSRLLALLVVLGVLLVASELQAASKPHHKPKVPDVAPVEPVPTPPPAPVVTQPACPNGVCPLGTTCGPMGCANGCTCYVQRSSGCANGSCGTRSRGWYLGKLLGRRR